MKVGIIVGHKANRPGACNKKYGMCEYQFNDQLACDIYDFLKDDNSHIHPVIIRRRTYKTLPDDVNNLNPAFAISLHCNALNGEINGTETLYYHLSNKSRKLADFVQYELLKALEFRDLGIKPTTVEDRGGHLLKYTHMPIVIAEPFFIDVDEAYEEASKKQPILVHAYSKAIIRFYNFLKSNVPDMRDEISRTIELKLVNDKKVKEVVKTKENEDG